MSAGAQHVVQRGNNREACFYDEADYKAYQSFLKDAAAKYRVAIHAFVLMTDHVHLLATPGDEPGGGRMMQAQGCKYVRYFNFAFGFAAARRSWGRGRTLHHCRRPRAGLPPNARPGRDHGQARTVVPAQAGTHGRCARSRDIRRRPPAGPYHRQ
jgi:REP element-mobilizing transposase RayT